MTKVRRHDIDWIRVLVFDILIIYHVGMFFVPWGWHIKNNDIVEWMALPMFFVNQWRLPILFVVSGIGTRYALSYRSGNEYVKERTKRLLIPLIVGILLIVPPQVYLERIVQGSFSGNYFQFYPNFFQGIYPGGNFSWHHLWFLPYLLLMSLIFTPLFLKWRINDNRFIVWIKGLLNKSPFFIYIFTIPLLFIEAFMEPAFPVTHALYGDWYALTFYTFLFIFGFILISTGEVFWKAVEKIKPFALFLGILCFPFLLWYKRNVDSSVWIPILVVFNMWSWILTIIGYSAKFLNNNSALIKYRNQAVYPFYILHQTITVIIGYYLINSPLHYGIKFVIMLVGTFGFSWILYEFIIRRIKFIRPLFGLKNQ